ncbi:MAG: right-handed parallel beta-helix repeat-containing protein [Flavobacteriales bacterium]|nr:right-handed parallel beta-helix repeat-containing protein [Flavobacteriales bacterium]
MRKIKLLGWLLLALMSGIVVESCNGSGDVETKDDSGTQHGVSMHFGSDEEMKLHRKLNQAMESGGLTSNDEDWVRGFIIEDSDTIYIEFRLRGDAVDSLDFERMSFRINTRNKKSFHDVRSFSIFPAHSRNFGDEWIAHQLLDQEDILTTRYGFFPLTVNGESWGMYAWEEHFDKQLVESRKRREGPIIKLDDNIAIELASAKWEDDQLIEHAAIVPFKSGKLASNEVLLNQFLDGQRLVKQFREGETSLSEIFDVQRLARLYALTDVMGSRRSVNWTNQRYYFNPISARLEPVAYKVYGKKGMGENNSAGRDYLANANITFDESPFLDSMFVSLYLSELERITSEGYLEQALEKIDTKKLAGLSDYSLDKQQWLKQRDQLRDDLSALKSDLLASMGKAERLQHDDRPSGLWQPVSTLGVQVFLKDSVGGKPVFELLNQFDRAIEILGFGTAVSMCYPLQKPTVLQPYGMDGSSTQLSSKGVYCYYRALGLYETHRAEALEWPAPEGFTTRQQLERKARIPQEFNITGRTLTLPKGNYTFSSQVFIPAGYNVIIEAGVEITLNHAGWLCYSAIDVKGTESEPVLVKGNGAQGFTVLNAPRKCTLQYCTFDGLDTQLLPGWTLTGAVNFYESDVELSHCRFLNNVCEDGLNIIRSDFMISACEIANTFADGFDADFCTGTIADSEVHHTGNDCLDFSTSTITVSNCHVYESGDKGISAGENSTLTVLDTRIETAEIGLASKDKSTIDVKNTSIRDCRYGYAMYRKKPEFGPAFITAESMNVTEVDTLQLIEFGSSLTLDGKEIKGDQTIDLARLYGL